MSTRPDWAMDRAAEIMMVATSQLRPTEQMRQIAALLELTQLEGMAEQAKIDSEHMIDGIDAAFRRHMQAAE